MNFTREDFMHVDFSFWFWGHTYWSQDLPLALCLGLTPGGAQEHLKCQDQTPVICILGRHPAHCAIIPGPMFKFFP